MLYNVFLMLLSNTCFKNSIFQC